MAPCTRTTLGPQPRSSYPISYAVFCLKKKTGLVCLAGGLSTRCWVDGPPPRRRTALRRGRAGRLPRLPGASLSGWGRTSGRQRGVADREGAHVLLDATNHRLTPPQEVRASYVPR